MIKRNKMKLEQENKGLTLKSGFNKNIQTEKVAAKKFTSTVDVPLFFVDFLNRKAF